MRYINKKNSALAGYAAGTLFLLTLQEYITIISIWIFVVISVLYDIMSESGPESVRQKKRGTL